MSKKHYRYTIGFIVVAIVIACLVNAFMPTTTSTTTSTETTTTTVLSDYDLYNWDETVAPNYYLVVGSAQGADASKNNGRLDYNSLDPLGRATGASGWITYAYTQENTVGGREDISSIKPTGYTDNAECDIITPNGDTYHGWFYNRSHLIADSLGGDGIAENLITGTRMQNVGANDNTNPGGMAYTETLARDWLKANPDGELYYSAVPNYQGNELVPRSVTVNIKTSDGSIDQEVIVYNTAKGYVIDYTTGEWSKE